MTSIDSPSSGFNLYVWPGRWELPSIDPNCLAAVLYLQLAIPGKFSIVECANPDLSPSGQLPFLVHEQQSISTLGPIIKFIAGLKKGGSENTPITTSDAFLSPRERAQKFAWCAHVESHFGDLVYHALYGVHLNWAELTLPALVTMLPVPQRYYVPGRLRDSYRPRLEASGLWNRPVDDKTSKKSFQESLKTITKEEDHKETFLHTFERDKILAKARLAFETYSRLLDSNSILSEARITALNVTLAAHTLLLLNPNYPDPLLKDLMLNSYPSLVAHAKKVYGDAFGPSAPKIPHASPPKYTLWTLIPYHSLNNRHQPRAKIPKTGELQSDTQFQRMRWGFFGLAAGCIIAFVTIMGSPIRVAIKRGEEDYREDAEEEEDLDTEDLDPTVDTSI
ncbi:outer mitochondrial membrane transport complex protein-domain-containing protein [Infundibulicybe gibba]|nr:outer mitochondrial membrane transport complex protein-domain-containing protein [Infundibulicybe gibba]